MSKALNIFSVIFQKYNHSLMVSPYKTKMITNGIIFGVADVICQKVIENKGQKKRLDYQRLLNMMIVGGVMAAPLLHLWYCKWAPTIVPKITSNTKVQPVLSMVLDQFVFTPPLMFSFLFINEFMKDYDVRHSLRHVRRKIWTGLKTNWTVWPPVQLINFTLIPIQLRVLFVNFVGLFWTIYLSYLQNSK